MPRSFTRVLVLALVAVLAGACSKSPRLAGPHTVLALEEGQQNPDVIWIVREVVTDRKEVGTVPLWGLYACYRSAEPGPPQCFLAQTSGDKEQLVWPDDPKKYKW